MSDPSRVTRLVRTSANRAGRQLAQARHAYRVARDSVYAGELPHDDAGRVRIVCRRHAERRAVRLDPRERPPCYDAGHRDCDGCVEDIRAGRIETW